MGEAGAYRVLMLISHFHPSIGGTERQALGLARKLVGLGHRVDVLTLRVPGLPGEETIDGVKVHRKIRVIKAPFLWGLSYLVSVFFFLLFRTGGYDIYHGHTFQGFHNTPAVILGRLRKVPVVVKLACAGRASDVLTLRGHAAGRLLEPVHRRVDRLVCTTEEMRREIREFGLDPDGDRAVVIPNAAVRPPKAPPGLRTLTGFGSDRPLVGFVGRLEDQKGVDILLEAMTGLAPGERPSLAVIGDGPRRADLEAMSVRMGLDDRVFFTGWLPEAPASLWEMGLLVLPSRWEGFPNILLEAMSVGVPVAASDLPVHLEILEDGRLGRIFPGESPEGLASVLREFLAGDAGYEERARRAGEAVSGRYSMERVAGQYLELYSRLTGASPGTPGAEE